MSRLFRVGLVFTHLYGYYRGVLRGIRRFLEARPNWLVTTLLIEEHPLRVPVRQRLNGLICTLDTRQVQQSLSGWDQPIVDVSSMFPRLAIPRVGVDYDLVGQMAAAHLLERGLRQFAYVGPSSELGLYSTECQASYCRSIELAGCPVECFECAVNLPFDAPGARWDLGPTFRKWLRALPGPVGIFVPNDFWGIQVAETCRRMRLRIPEDVALLGSNNDDLLCQLTRPPLSSIILPAEQIGYEAAVVLERLLEGGPVDRGPVLLPPLGVATRCSTETLAFDDAELVAALRYIRDHVHEALCVEDVLRQVPVGRRTLERRCRKALGWGIGDEIKRTRLERARQLLALTDLPVKAVALRCGYSGLRHLGEAFRATLRTSPTAYRERIRHGEAGLRRNTDDGWMGAASRLGSRERSRGG